MTKELANKIRDLFGKNMLQTDSDIEDFLNENNSQYMTFKEEDLDNEDFLESEEYKTYMENPNVVSFDEVLKVMANSTKEWERCHGCEHICNLFYHGYNSPCEYCSRHVKVKDYFKMDAFIMNI